MAIPNIFKQETIVTLISRIEKLTPQIQPIWGSMDVAKMLAHVNVTYDLNEGKIKSKTPFIMKLILKAFVKPMVVGEAPYKHHSRTAPVFLITSEKDFETEKAKLIANINTVQAKGETHFEGRESGSFGKLTANEWNNLFYKHLDHHFNQFGV
ncbi:MAG: hypothetical protein K9G64_08420 [Bacteroidia bacterium]|jgi:hypothetical protein|nr:hypothetical protein [Bacteroidia bacterium]